MKKDFKKEYLKTKEDNEDFEIYTKCRICDNAHVNNYVKVRNHC